MDIWRVGDGGGANINTMKTKPISKAAIFLMAAVALVAVDHKKAMFDHSVKYFNNKNKSKSRKYI